MARPYERLLVIDFETYFDYPYPYKKYDHIFIPDFIWGAMENPGAVSMNESRIYRGPRPTIDFEKRDYIFLHEMAHMWFGALS